MTGASKTERVFVAGSIAPESGVYVVLHEKHRERHSATIFKGERFPACARCGSRVRYLLSRPAALISEDLDFSQVSDITDSHNEDTH